MTLCLGPQVSPETCRPVSPPNTPSTGPGERAGEGACGETMSGGQGTGRAPEDAVDPPVPLPLVALGKARVGGRGGVRAPPRNRVCAALGALLRE